MPFIVPALAAIGGGSALAGAAIAGSAGVGLYSANKSASAIKKASAAQQASAQAGIDEQQRQFDITQQNLAPYLAAGTDALGAQRNLLGLGGQQSQEEAIAQLQASPLYQSLYRTGKEAVLQSGAATGGLRGGNIQRSLADFGADTLTRVIEAQLSRLGGLSSQGAQSAMGQGLLGQNNANAIAELLTGQGNAQSAGILGAQSANNKGLDILVSALGRLGGLGGGIKGGSKTTGGYTWNPNDGA